MNNSQKSLTDQLKQSIAILTKSGLYDAADFISNSLTNVQYVDALQEIKRLKLLDDTNAQKYDDRLEEIQNLQAEITRLESIIQNYSKNSS